MKLSVSDRLHRLRLPSGAARLGNRLSRVRYIRGHGVHSPFVYALVRQVFMRRELLPGDRTFYEALLAAGTPVRRAVQLQNLAIHCGYDGFGMNRAEGALCVATRALPLSETLALVAGACEAGRTVVVMEPYEGSLRQDMCRRIVAAHRSTSVDNRAYLLLFNSPSLPRQHYRL